MLREELRVEPCRNVREEAVLAGGKRQPRYVFAAYWLAVQTDAAVVAQKAQDALHESGFAGAVLSEKPHYLAGTEGKAYVFQRLLVSVSFIEFLYLKHFAASRLSVEYAPHVVGFGHKCFQHAQYALLRRKHLLRDQRHIAQLIQRHPYDAYYQHRSRVDQQEQRAAPEGLRRRQALHYVQAPVPFKPQVSVKYEDGA